MSFVLIVIGTVLPFRIGFQVEIEVTSVIGVASVLTDVLFIVDIVLNFNTGYTRPDGQFEMNRKKARLYYLKHPSARKTKKAGRQTERAIKSRKKWDRQTELSLRRKGMPQDQSCRSNPRQHSAADWAVIS